MAKKKRKLKKSVKISLIAFVLILAGSIGWYEYQMMVKQANFKPTYGSVQGYNGNSELGKIDTGDEESSQLPTLTYIVLDTADGYSIFIDYQNTEVLIDAGAKPKSIIKTIKPYIKDDIDYVIATNESQNKIGSLPEIYKSFPVKNTIYNGDDNNPQIKALLAAAQKSKISKGKDANIMLGTGATLTIFNVTKDAQKEGDKALSTVLSYGNTKFAETGDLSEQFAARLVNKLEGANVLVTATNSSAKLNEVLRPAYYVISTGKKIPQKDIDMLTEGGKSVFTTKANGTIVFKSDGSEVTSNKDE